MERHRHGLGLLYDCFSCQQGSAAWLKEDIELTRSVPGANLLLNAAVARANR